MENSLVVTMVLYQTEFSQTPSYSLLKKFLTEKNDFYLFIYDNSKEMHNDEIFNQSNVVYVHDKTNPGLAKAYNAGSQFLSKVKGELLLILDQDTSIDDAYLQTLTELEIMEEVGAYVPVIESHGRRISPVFSEKYITGQTKFPNPGMYSTKIMAINSGTVLPRETLIEIGAFNEAFPLDFLDHWLFWQLHQQHKKVCVLTNRLSHDLSVLDYRNVSALRYESIVSAETLFYSKYDQEKLVRHKKQLLLRTVKQFLRVKNRKIWRRTFSEFVSLMKGK